MFTVEELKAFPDIKIPQRQHHADITIRNQIVQANSGNGTGRRKAGSTRTQFDAAGLSRQGLDANTGLTFRVFATPPNNPKHPVFSPFRLHAQQYADL